jgi:hypothetical protein
MYHSTHDTFFAVKSCDVEFGLPQSRIFDPNFDEPPHNLTS